MAVSFPYSVAYFFDKLLIDSVVWDIQRNDEFSGLGTGQIWQAEMAPPLWLADVSLTNLTVAQGKQAAALIRRLQGSQEAFFLCDPSALYPQSDPTGSIIGSSTVQINTVPSTNANRISLKGLPAGYVLTTGDKLQIRSTGSPDDVYSFLEVSEDVTANGSGVTPAFDIFPARSGYTAVNDVVTLKKPACLMKLYPGSHNPGGANIVVNSGAGFKAIQKVR